MKRQARIYMHDIFAGRLTEDETGFSFSYVPDYLARPDARPISLTLPLSDRVFHDKRLFPFFDGLVPEGWLLDIVGNTWKIDPRDRMGLLLTCCRDCIGAVSVFPDGDSP